MSAAAASVKVKIKSNNDKQVEGVQQEGVSAANVKTVTEGSQLNSQPSSAVSATSSKDQKSSGENDVIAALVKRIEALEGLKKIEGPYNFASTGFKWDTIMTTVGTLEIPDGSFPGTFYKTSINKGTLALRMENGRTSKPGVLRIGVKLKEDKKEILMLARIHKTRNHDFYVSF